MLTCVTAYLVVALAVLAYIVRLSSTQFRLRRRAAALQKQAETQRPARRRAA